MIDRDDILDYEIRASAWWVGKVGWAPLSKLVAKYFAWKVRRKYDRYMCSMIEKRRVQLRNQKHWRR